MAKQNERPTMLVEDIDHIVHNIAFDYLVLSAYGNSSFLKSLGKSITYSMQMSLILWVPPQSLLTSKAL